MDLSETMLSDVESVVFLLCASERHFFLGGRTRPRIRTSAARLCRASECDSPEAESKSKLEIEARCSG